MTLSQHGLKKYPGTYYSLRNRSGLCAWKEGCKEKMCYLKIMGKFSRQLLSYKRQADFSHQFFLSNLTNKLK